jgi:hypothetical protein
MTDGVRRVGPTGEIAFPMQEVVGLDVRKGNLPLLSYLLTADRWPTSGAREIRLPPLADVEVTLLEAPDALDGEWMDAADVLGAARAPLDGPIHPPEGDAEAATQLESQSLGVSVGLVGVRGPLAAKTATARLSVPVGRTFALRLRYGEQNRVFEFKPQKAGPLSLSARWGDLRIE